MSEHTTKPPTKKALRTLRAQAFNYALARRKNYRIDPQHPFARESYDYVRGLIDALDFVLEGGTSNADLARIASGQDVTALKKRYAMCPECEASFAVREAENLPAHRAFNSTNLCLGSNKQGER